MKNILVTGGLGFIGSCFVVKQVKKGNFIVNVDKITYAANEDNVCELANNKNYKFIKEDICNKEAIYKALNEFQIDKIINFAAESHVDNSISGAKVFIETNINGTFAMLEAARQYYESLNGEKKENFRFLHVSTDEVFGSLKETDAKFKETNPYKPNSPYSASKAASDHLVRAWNETYKLPTLITNCSNNFGPRQHKEKLIPTIINACVNGKDIPIYGNGKNIRDWIYVEDHCDGIELALNKGKIGESYCFGGENEIRNIEIANLICEIMDEIKPEKTSYKNQIKFVEDRKGHDFRYAIDNEKVNKELGFKVSKSFNDRLKETVLWYLK